MINQRYSRDKCGYEFNYLESLGFSPDNMTVYKYELNNYLEFYQIF